MDSNEKKSDPPLYDEVERFYSFPDVSPKTASGILKGCLEDARCGLWRNIGELQASRPR
ncbi:hypothetical protein L9F63_004398, partial [Diploptera punctata]